MTPVLETTCIVAFPDIRRISYIEDYGSKMPDSDELKMDFDESTE